MNVRICAFDACGRTHYARGYCGGHYKQLRDGRDLQPLESRNAPIAVRLAEHTQRSNDCWVWGGGMSDEGYGRIWFEGRYHGAHRIAYELAFGPIEDGMEVDHKCNNRPCVRPDHLQSVTPKRNNENRAGATARSKSGVRGVNWNRWNKKWQASVRHNGHLHHVGYFASIKEADQAAQAKRNELFDNNLADHALIGVAS